MHTPTTSFHLLQQHIWEAYIDTEGFSLNPFVTLYDFSETEPSTDLSSEDLSSRERTPLPPLPIFEILDEDLNLNLLFEQPIDMAAQQADIQTLQQAIAALTQALPGTNQALQANTQAIRNPLRHEG